ncbi:MAG: AmmeMemoRadiSam system radical SAM enzyme [archaeon]|nr:AmmeMemoRadiSam system radical SAM enzyme [archaeon]MCP8306924.1 AmmeMemoRadiSam system radical SAM enzyme [archaeon]
MKEAMFYEKLGGDLVQCHLCSHHCRINKGKRGICGVRENIDGTLYSLVYGKLIASSVDPIEKKPLFHFLPGSRAYSIATVGCNFRCLNCQNFDISQMPKPQKPVIGDDVTPNEIVDTAKHYNCESIAYTYTEPTIFFEYAYETAKLASKEGIRNIFVTNGYITEEALRVMAPYLDAANIDLKSFSDEFYRKICGARLKPVLDSIRLHKEMGIWIEITTLVIPSLNDSEENFKKIAEFIKGLDESIPWHVTQFYPAYRLLDLAPTPVETLDRAKKIGLEIGLKHIYQGNIPGEGENTYCPNCRRLLIERYGYRVNRYDIKDSRCPYCGEKIYGVWRQ